MLQWFHADRLVMFSLPASRLRVQDHLKAALMGIELAGILVRVFGFVKFGERVVLADEIDFTDIV
jgi:hypothetical protein